MRENSKRGLALALAAAFGAGFLVLGNGAELVSGQAGLLPAGSNGSLLDGIYTFWNPADEFEANYSLVRGHSYTVGSVLYSVPPVNLSCSLTTTLQGLDGSPHPVTYYLYGWELEHNGGCKFRFGVAQSGDYTLRFSSSGPDPANVYLTLDDDGPFPNLGDDSLKDLFSGYDGATVLDAVDYFGETEQMFRSRSYYLDLSADTVYTFTFARVTPLADFLQEPSINVSLQHVDERDHDPFELYRDEALPDYEGTPESFLNTQVWSYEPNSVTVSFGVARAGRYELSVDVWLNGSDFINLLTEVDEWHVVGDGDEDFPPLTGGEAGNVSWGVSPGDRLVYDVVAGNCTYTYAFNVTRVYLDYDWTRSSLPDTNAYSWVDCNLTVSGLGGSCDPPMDLGAEIWNGNGSSVVAGRANQAINSSSRAGVIPVLVPVNTTGTTLNSSLCLDPLAGERNFTFFDSVEYGDTWWNGTDTSTGENLFVNYTANGTMGLLRHVDGAGNVLLEMRFNPELSYQSSARGDGAISIASLVVDNFPHVVLGVLGVTVAWGLVRRRRDARERGIRDVGPVQA
ncbi:MAG: hypothetical protein ACTSU5_22155 [Promethearchaeota archaeon]